MRRHPAAWSQLGWKARSALAFGFGLCATLALPPFNLFPFWLPAYGGLFLLLAFPPTGAAPLKRAFADGWWWGWGHHISGLYWFCIALLTEPEKFAWMIPFALFGVTAVVALHSGLACALAVWLRARLATTSPMLSPLGLWLFCACFLLVEWARGHWLSGFPWNLAGYGFAFSDAAMQPAALVGVYGLTFFALLLGAAPALLFAENRRLGLRWALGCWALFALALGWGQLRLLQAEGSAAQQWVEGVRVRLVQANIAQPHKWDPALQRAGLDKHIALSRQQSKQAPTLVIWPETAAAYAVQPGSALMQALSRAVPPGGVLVTGALRLEQAEGDDFRVYNSLITIDEAGALLAHYDKHKLVPFGEFLPLRWLLPASWLTPVGSKDFSAGPGPATISLPNMPSFSPLICYEAIFPWFATKRDSRPHLLLNITNDAWFGISTGPYQHFTMARFRAVEQGIPLVRAANTGISAVTDSYGRVEKQINLQEEGVADFMLRKSQPYATVYSGWGELPIVSLILAIGVLMLWQQRPKIT